MAHTILIIDSDEMALLVRKMVLEDASYVVVTARSASQALQVFATHLVDAVITDHMLLKDSGVALGAELRRLSPKLPVLTLSGGISPQDEVDPPDYFLHKLDGPVELVAKVQAMILATSPSKRFSWDRPNEPIVCSGGYCQPALANKQLPVLRLPV